MQQFCGWCGEDTAGMMRHDLCAEALRELAETHEAEAGRLRASASGLDMRYPENLIA